MKLSDAKARKVEPIDKEVKLTGAGQLYLYVSTSGTRSWCVNYTHDVTAFGSPKRKPLTLGIYPAVTLSMARSARDDDKALVREGKVAAANEVVGHCATYPGELSQLLKWDQGIMCRLRTL